MVLRGTMYHFEVRDADNALLAEYYYMLSLARYRDPVCMYFHAFQVVHANDELCVLGIQKQAFNQKLDAQTCYFLGRKMTRFLQPILPDIMCAQIRVKQIRAVPISPPK